MVTCLSMTVPQPADEPGVPERRREQPGPPGRGDRQPRVAQGAAHQRQPGSARAAVRAGALLQSAGAQPGGLPADADPGGDRRRRAQPRHTGQQLKENW